MKGLNVKRIVAVAAGATLLGIGLAFSGPVTFQNVPIINNAGQPVVQVVLGSHSAPSDGVAAANIAAAIGNLAFTSVPVTASVNMTQAESVLHVSVSSPQYSLSNQQVWLNESSSAVSAGSYGFQALIGSVLNRGVKLNSPSSTKSIDNTGSYSYNAATPVSLTSSPIESPYATAGFVPTSTTVSASNNGGGVSFTSFRSSNKFDNILDVGSSSLPSLLNNAGSYGETEHLWLTGFPVYDQASGVNNFALVDANGAYQVVFNKPIDLMASGATVNSNHVISAVNNAQFSLLGQNWTIINATIPSAHPSSSSFAVNGGKLQVASSLTPLSTVYVGQNLTSGPFKAVLTDLGQPNSNGVVPASIDLYYNGKLTNQSSVKAGTTVQYNVSGNLVYLRVNQTFAGLYAYSKWAKMQLYSNVMNLTDGKVFNATTNPNWQVNLLWTNTTTTSTGNAIDLQSIILYGTSSLSTTLTPGQSFSFVTNPSVWKLQFIGDTLGTSQFDPVTITSSTAGSVQYQNLATPSTVSGLAMINNVTEPAQELTVGSSISDAFSYAGQTGSSVVYDLTPYQLTESANAASISTTGTNVILTSPNGNFISSTNPLSVTLTGYPSSTATSPVSTSVSFSSDTSGSAYNNTAPVFYNITNMQLSRALPGSVSVAALASTGSGGATFSGQTATYTSANTLTFNVVTGNTVTFSTGTGNTLSFSGSVGSGGTLPLTGNVGVVIGMDNPTTLPDNSISVSGNIPFSGNLPLTGATGSVFFSGNVPVSGSFSVSNTATTYAVIPVSGVVTVSTNAVISGSIDVTSGNVQVYGSNTVADLANPFTFTSNEIASGSLAATKTLATLSNTPTAEILYTQTGTSYDKLASASSVSYNQQSGEPSTTFTLAGTSVLPANAVQDQYFTYNMVENPVPGSTSYTDALSFGIVNSTAGPSATPLFQLNYSAASLSSTVPGTRNNMTYLSTDNGVVNAPQGFRTEKGSKVASISPTTLTVDFAKAVDELQFAVGPSTATVSTKSSKLYGPHC